MCSSELEAFIVPSGVLLLRELIRSLLSDKPLQLSLFNEGFNMLFQVVTVGRVMTVVLVEAAILIFRAPVGIFLQLPGVSQGFLIFDLHHNLIYRGRKWGEACKPSPRGLGATFIPSISRPGLLAPLVLSGIILPFPFSRFLLPG